MRLPVFLVHQGTGSLLFAAARLGLGRAFDDRIMRLLEVSTPYIAPAAKVLAAGLVVWLIYVTIGKRHH